MIVPNDFALPQKMDFSRPFLWFFSCPVFEGLYHLLGTCLEVVRWNVGWSNKFINVVKKLALARKWCGHNHKNCFLGHQKCDFCRFWLFFDTKMPLDTKVCTFPCSPSDMSYFKQFSKTYVSGVDVSNFHHYQSGSSKNLVFSFFCNFSHQNQNCGLTAHVGRLGLSQIDFLGHITL